MKTLPSTAGVDDNAGMGKTLKMLFLLVLLCSPAARAAATQSHARYCEHARIHDTVRAFVASQTRALPGKTTFQITDIDARLALPGCDKLEAFLAPGVQLNGSTNVGVRCTGSRGWSIFVPVTIYNTSHILVLKRTLHGGQTVSAEDISSVASDTVQAGSLTSPEEAIGKVMKYGVGAGQILRYDMLRAPYTVRLGQTVQLRVKGGGFSVSSEAQALGNAADGDTTPARTASGQIVNGIAKNGAIEIYQ